MTGRREGLPALALLAAACVTLHSCAHHAATRSGPAAVDARPASLVAFAKEADGRPVEGCLVVIRQLDIGGMADALGCARIAKIAPGTWNVSWGITGAVGDSARVKFSPGREETLTVLVRFEGRESVPGAGTPNR